MKFSNLYPKGAVHYPGVLLRFPAALIVANYLVVYGEPERQLELIKYPFYYSALLWSGVITVAISEFIYLITKVLDYQYSWKERLERRTGAQFLLGVLIPICMVYGAVAFYFYESNALENYTNYMKFDFPIVMCFVLFLNGYYLIVYLYKIKIVRKKIPNRYEVKPITLTTVAVIFSEDGAIFAYTFEGVKISWPETIDKSMQLLGANDYFLINRSQLVHVSSVVEYLPHYSRTLKLVLIAQLPNEKEFIVSQRRSVAFKNWYKIVRQSL